MTKWTYMNERVPRERLIEFLLLRGKDGWELCAALDCEAGQVDTIYKRAEP
jgi:hypothetical protein